MLLASGVVGSSIESNGRVGSPSVKKTTRRLAPLRPSLANKLKQWLSALHELVCAGVATLLTLAARCAATVALPVNGSEPPPKPSTASASFDQPTSTTCGFMFMIMSSETSSVTALPIKIDSDASIDCERSTRTQTSSGTSSSS